MVGFAVLTRAASGTRPPACCRCTRTGRRRSTAPHSAARGPAPAPVSCRSTGRPAPCKYAPSARARHNKKDSTQGAQAARLLPFVSTTAGSNCSKGQTLSDGSRPTDGFSAHPKDPVLTSHWWVQHSLIGPVLTRWVLWRYWCSWPGPPRDCRVRCDPPAPR